MKVAQPLSVTIRQIEFELKMAEHGVGMSYGAETSPAVARHAPWRPKEETVRRAEGEREQR